MDDIRFVERSTGEVRTEAVYGRRALSLLYGDSKAARFFSWLLLPFLARMPLLSRFYGFLQTRASSQKKIAPFIQAFGIDASEFAEPVSSFGSFNDFFIRKLKPASRPIAPDPASIAMPADGRYLVYPDVGRASGFYIKGQKFDLASLLQDDALAERYRSGSMAIARLCPTDYHRFHFPLDGIALPPKAIDGTLYSVNPAALSRRLPILWENKRVLTRLQTEGGLVLMIEVGATCVGTIHQTFAPQTPVKKGAEKGYFSFGGSCMVLLFEKGRVLFDEDLVRNSSQFLETRGLFGASFGRIM